MPSDVKSCFMKPLYQPAIIEVAILCAGLAGSVLEEKLNRTSTPKWYCSKEADWQVIWLSLTAASRPDCLLDELYVSYNTTDGRQACHSLFTNTVAILLHFHQIPAKAPLSNLQTLVFMHLAQPAVTTSCAYAGCPPHHASLQAAWCRYYNQTGVEIRAYQFGNLTGVASLDPDLPSVSGTYEKLIDGLQAAGYAAGQDLFGAPYDFRLAADGLEQVQSHEMDMKIALCSCRWCWGLPPD